MKYKRFITAILVGLALMAGSSLRAASINWISADVGTPTLAGSVTDNGDGTKTIVGGGDDIWNASDNFHFYYAWASGNTWDAVVQVRDLQGPDYWTKCELMVRVSDPLIGPRGPDAWLGMMVCPVTNFLDGAAARNCIIDQFRTAYNGSSDWKQVGTDPVPRFPNAWVKIHRDGSVFSLYWATNSTDWNKYMDINTATGSVVGQDNGTTFGPPTWPTGFPDIVAVGIGVTAHNDGDTTGGIATIGNLSATFPPVEAPTAIGVSQQIQGSLSGPFGSEATLSFAATNNATPIPVPTVYQWYKNGTAIAGSTASVHTWLLNDSDNGAQYYCKATCPPPYTSVPALDSAMAAVSVTAASYFTNGLKQEFWTGLNSSAGVATVENGNIGPASSLGIFPDLDNPGGFGDNYVNRLSGWFIAPATTNYTFYLAADDATDLLLSTDADPTHKQLIAQETGWTGTRNWLGNNYPTTPNSQQISTTFSPDGGLTYPFQNGFDLTAGQRYYIELIHWQGGGGDNLGVTYRYSGEYEGIDYPTNGAAGRIMTDSLVLASGAATTLTWVEQPTNTVAAQGFDAVFYASAASNGEFDPVYQWYRGTTLIAGATSSRYGFATTSGDNGATFTVVASTALGELSITSSPAATLTVVPPVYEAGYARVDWWWGTQDRQPVIDGTARAADNIISSPRFEAGVNNGTADNYVNRVSGFFTPPADGQYVFFVCADDTADLFISTDNTAANKYMIAQETSWSNPFQWVTSGGGSSLTQKRSDSWSPDGGLTFPYSGGIQLFHNQKYYLEVDHSEGGGGDNVEVTYKTIFDSDPVDGTDSLIAGSQIGMNAPFCSYVNFTQQPQNQTVPFNGVATFTAAGTTDSKVAVGPTGNPNPYWNNFIIFQWRKNGVDIAGATGSSYTFGPVSPLDSGAQFTCRIRALGFADNTGVPKWTDSTPATLTVSGNAVFEQGFALHAFWELNPPITSIANHTAGDPSWVTATPSFEMGVNGGMGDNYANALYGFFIPPADGDYVFFCNSDDDANLFVSTDNSASNLRMVAQETAWSSGDRQWGTSQGVLSQVRSDTFVDPATGLVPYAAGIHLNGGQKYFMAAFHHEGGGGDYLEINAKQLYDMDPTPGSPSVITDGQVGFYAAKCSYVNFTDQPQDVTVENYASASFSAGGTTDSTTPVGPNTDPRNYRNNFLFFQWYSNGVAVAGANTAQFTIPTVLPSGDGAQIMCQMRALGLADAGNNPIWSNSQPATLHVTTTTPHFLFSGYYVNSNYTDFFADPTNYVTLTFDLPMDPGGLANPSTYTLIGGGSILGVFINSNDTRRVSLAVSGQPTSITVNGTLHTLGGGQAVATTTLSVSTTTLLDRDIGTPGSDPAIPGMLYLDGPNAYTIACEGSDIWNDHDGFNFLYEQKTGDFDVVVRHKSITHTSQWAKGGLMVRDVLDAYSRNWNIINDPRSDDGIMAPDGSGYGANMVECNWRTNSATVSTGWDNIPRDTPPAYPNAWVRLKRVGQLLTAYYGTDGRTWKQAASMDVSTTAGGLLPQTVYVGICQTAHNNDAIVYPPTPYDQLLYVNTASYDNYNSSYVASPILTITPSGANVSVSWTPAGMNLYSSPDLVTWTLIPGASNPYVTAASGSAMFFMVAP